VAAGALVGAALTVAVLAAAAAFGARF